MTRPTHPRALAKIAALALLLPFLASCGEDDRIGERDSTPAQSEPVPPAAVDADPTPQSGTGGRIPQNEPAPAD